MALPLVETVSRAFDNNLALLGADGTDRGHFPDIDEAVKTAEDRLMELRRAARFDGVYPDDRMQVWAVFSQTKNAAGELSRLRTDLESFEEESRG